MPRFITPREHHDSWVNAWIARTAKTSTATERLALYDEAFGALWRRASLTLGDRTLLSVAQRTVRLVAVKFPQLATLEVAAEGLSLRELRQSSGAVGDRALPDALRFLLVELLADLGQLTGETLTPLLHRSLARSGEVGPWED